MRQDIAVYNEATGFTIHSAGFCGKDRDDLSENFRAHVEDGTILAFSLVQDSSPHIRLITDALTREEDAEWVSKVVWKLRVPDGELVFEGGFDPRGPNDDFMRTVSVPPGDYRVEIYTLYWSINGLDTLHGDDREPFGSWFRRTRPGEEFPDIMKFYLGEDPDDDPGHEDEWTEFYDSEDYEELEEPDMVDFIVRLTPLSGADNLTLQCDDTGWFPVGLNPRKPAKCPIGIKFNRGDDDDDHDDDEDSDEEE
ncbi:MAG: hypothetical protein HUU46_19820 [Candidatus Hydrogenedentes bacterium]|nr:hypothetical protein [Candidatus Hydrogenedentota bacterium]